MKTIYKILFILLLTTAHFVYGWSDELKDAAEAVAAGTATPEQKNMVIRENVTINEMATHGEISDKIYQKAQQAHQEMVNKNARAAANEAGIDVSNPDAPVDAKHYAPGTDTDLGLDNPNGSTVTSQQSKQARENFNRKMNQELKTSGVDYAKKHDVDFMPDPKGHTQKSFTEGNKFNKEPYESIDATRRELKKQSGEAPTSKESKAYVDEMQGQMKHKNDELSKLKQDARANKKLDPQGESARTKSTDAQVTQKQQKKQKYNERINAETADIHNRNKLDGDLPKGSDLSKRAADRNINVTKEKAAEIANKKLDYASKINPDDVQIKEIDTPDGKKTVAEVTDGKGGKRIITEEDITKLNRNNAHASDVMDEHLIKQSLQNNAEVRAGAASKGGPDAKQHLADSAELGNKLAPNKQGELIENVRTKYGDDAAKDLAAEMRRQKAEGSGVRQKSPDDILVKSDIVETKVKSGDVATGKARPDVDVNGPKADVDVPGKSRELLNDVGKAQEGLDILNTAQDIKDVISGKKSASDAAIDTADRFSGGSISTVKTIYKKGDDYNEASKANAYADKKLAEARALEAGLDLRKNGVSKEETERIMEAMRNGNDNLLQEKINELKKDGINIKIPDQIKKGSVEADDTVAERAWETGKGMMEGMEKDAERAGNFVWDMFKDLAEINESVEDIKDKSIYTVKTEIDAALQRAALRQKLIDKGVDPETADQAIEKMANGDSSGLRDIRKQLAAEQNKKDEEDLAEGKDETNQDANEEIIDGSKNQNNEGDNDTDAQLTQLRDAENDNKFDAGAGFDDNDFPEDKPDPGEEFVEKTYERNQDNSKNAQELHDSINEIADASIAGDKTTRDSENIIDQANIDAQQTINDAQNKSNADYNENSFGNQLNNEITDGIKTGFESAGTAVGTAIGEAAVRHNIHKDRDDNHPENRPPANNPPNNTRKPSSSSGVSSTASSGHRWPICPICGRRHKPNTGTASKPPSASSDGAAITVENSGRGSGQVVPVGTHRTTYTIKGPIIP